MFWVTTRLLDHTTIVMKVGSISTKIAPLHNGVMIILLTVLSVSLTNIS